MNRILDVDGTTDDTRAAGSDAAIDEAAGGSLCTLPFGFHADRSIVGKAGIGRPPRPEVRVTRDYVMALSRLADGRSRFGRAYPRRSPVFVKDLFIGSEGPLGIITEVCSSWAAARGSTNHARRVRPDRDDAETVSAIIRARILPASSSPRSDDGLCVEDTRRRPRPMRCRPLMETAVICGRRGRAAQMAAIARPLRARRAHRARSAEGWRWRRHAARFFRRCATPADDILET